MNVKKKTINEKVTDHIKRLQLQCVSLNEYKGALEAFAALNKISYPDMMQMLDDYRDYVMKNQKEDIWKWL